MKPLKESKKVAERFKRIFLLKATILFVAFFFALSAKAQEMESAIGGRLSYGGLISYQHKLNQAYLAEGIFALRWSGIEITGLVERYKPAFSKNTFWYIGAGMHLGIHGRNNVINPLADTNSRTYINLGIDFIGGLIYYFPDVPINISADYKPAFHFTGTRVFVGEGLGLSLRYVLK